jgi:DNA-binding NtrC family response regulator
MQVVFVDDESRVLAGIERTLVMRETDWACRFFTSGQAALDALETEPADVVVSDMRMPGMDGATFLAQAREQAPDAVRILLTGQADVESSIAAINRGAIFRYLCKPCPSDVLIAALDDAVRHYNRMRAERELLETTLTAAVNTLTEVLAMVAPWAFQRATFAHSAVQHALSRLDWSDGWIYSIAAALSQLGCAASACISSGGMPTQPSWLSAAAML